MTMTTMTTTRAMKQPNENNNNNVSQRKQRQPQQQPTAFERELGSIDGRALGIILVLNVIITNIFSFDYTRIESKNE